VYLSLQEWAILTLVLLALFGVGLVLRLKRLWWARRVRRTARRPVGRGRR
jgi:hypothetical protein